MIDELEKKQSEMLSAFPNGNLFPGNRGLTMRDAFAIAALKGELASQTIPCAYDETTMNNLSEWCYKLADAMMLAREKS